MLARSSLLQRIGHVARSQPAIASALRSTSALPHRSGTSQYNTRSKLPSPPPSAPAAAKLSSLSLSPGEAEKLASTTTAADLHTLPESGATAAESSPTDYNWSADGKLALPNFAAKNASVNESRPAALGSDDPDMNPRVATPSMFERHKVKEKSSSGPRGYHSSSGLNAVADAISSQERHHLPRSYSKASTGSSAARRTTTSAKSPASLRASGSANSAAASAHFTRPPAPGAHNPSIGSSVAAPSLENAGSTQQAIKSSLPSPLDTADASTPPELSAPSQQQTSFDHLAQNYAGMGSHPFDSRIANILSAPLNDLDIEIKPDGIIYLPEIKYRRILNKAFGPGGWGLAPRGETNVGPRIVSREWMLICLGRFVSTARGEQEYFDPSGIATASEGAKSNALMRCCKDLGIASELWDPRFVREFKSKHTVEVWAEGVGGKKRRLWRRKDQPPFEYPWKEKQV
ncbi:Mgm101p-domain-containing protein [Tilletiaria anomala UBC 951]|uniref:Mitochondrial genome maintenance protein MGM101 n=1 Tax=Tilletiaria anomala (strain ATCC 24038 / CBS 436.72 / UBC 951) TaxID=1037660 RepID=A0A066WJP9_TILAU|nr:Mgm101p-domain-containing protein [Tilletiaria anomala UBC 951]KDN52783.1 Mgm101p-domain-containing protein [Tilletiaria anomala UBC 951]